jgi:hypothetical protein
VGGLGSLFGRLLEGGKLFKCFALACFAKLKILISLLHHVHIEIFVVEPWQRLKISIYL